MEGFTKSKQSQKVSFEIIRKSFLPFAVFLVVLGLYGFYKLKVAPLLPFEAQAQYTKYIATVFLASIGLLIQRIIWSVLSWYKENVTIKTSTRLDDELIPLLQRVCKIIMWIIILLIILPLYGININGLIATLGVSSLAIALAAQDTISNIIAGFMIMLDRPFRIGDRIRLPSGEIVEVLDLGVRRSQFLSEDNAIIIVPNLELSKSKIVNYTYGEERLEDIK